MPGTPPNPESPAAGAAGAVLTADTVVDPLIGRRLAGKYRVLRVLGRGGMATVYEAEGPDGVQLAVKCITAGNVSDPETTTRFVREARWAMAITSPHVARTLDAGVDEDGRTLFIVMELLRGVDLATLLRRQGALHPPVVVQIFLQAARGVAAAHQLGIIHRDLKPANIFLCIDDATGNVTVKVCDFGIAKRVGPSLSEYTDPHVLTQTGGMLGSPVYMSPEQAQSAKSVDPRTDVWSLAITMYEALTGVRPWSRHTSLGQIILAIGSMEIDWVQDLAPWVDTPLARALHAGLTRDRERRIQSMTDFIAALTPHAGGGVTVTRDELRSADTTGRAPGAERAQEFRAQATVALIGGGPVRPEPAAQGAGPGVRSQLMGDPEVEREICALVTEALARFGAAGRAQIEAGRVLLIGGGPPVSTELGFLVTQWDTLPLDVRRRRCTEVARFLVGERRASVAAPAVSRGFALPSWLGPLGAVALLGLAGFGVYELVLGGSAKPAASSQSGPTAEEYERERDQRAARVCEATRTRVLQGATVGPTDVEGWVIEIAGLRGGDTADLGFDPALNAFVDRGPGQASGRFVWTAAKPIAEQTGPDTAVIVTDASVPPGPHPKLRGVRLTFTGRYVTPYFREEDRGVYFQVASALATRLGLTHAAMFARCLAGQTHHIGTWFVGPTPGGAVASLVFFMGLYADVPHLRSALRMGDAGEVDLGMAWDNIESSTRKLDRARVASVAGAHAAQITGKADGPQSITFPYKDGSRASRASRAFADDAQLGDGR